MDKTRQYLECKEKARRTTLFLLRVYVASLIVLLACLRVEPRLL